MNIGEQMDLKKELLREVDYPENDGAAALAKRLLYKYFNDRRWNKEVNLAKSAAPGSRPNEPISI